jgi:hypothetical protein
VQIFSSLFNAKTFAPWVSPLLTLKLPPFCIDCLDPDLQLLFHSHGFTVEFVGESSPYVFQNLVSVFKEPLSWMP